MKKFFITIGVLVLALSIFGIYDNSQRKKEAEEIAAKTSTIYATVEEVKEEDGKNKVTVLANDDDSNDEKIKGKKYTFTEGKVEKLEVYNEENEKAKIKDVKVGKKIVIQHIGDIKKGDVNELTGEITFGILADTNDSSEPTNETEASTDKSEEKATE